MKKSIIVGLFAITLLFCITTGCLSENTRPASVTETEINNKAISAIINNYAERNFLPGEITSEEIDVIIEAAVRSPSARNGQPWHFTVVQKDKTLAKNIISNTKNGSIIVVISGKGDGKTNTSVILDCALATENIYLAAQSLGLGSRILTGPVDSINSKYKKDLGLPDGYNAVATVLIGRIEQPVDAESSASRRKPAEEIVSFK